jgi:hypothetical protein
MAVPAEFSGDQCVVLPADYLQSADAAAELYAEEIARVVTDLEIQSLDPHQGFFRGTLLASILWMAPSIWTICI